jgi:hypothetical protein
MESSGGQVYLSSHFRRDPDLPGLYDVDAIVRQNSSWQSLRVDEVFGEPAA